MIPVHLVPAVAYYRMSTDRQDKSIPEQRIEVIALAKKKGYRILREYCDEGISGDATEKRLAFQRMVRDAVEKRDFVVILCWDQDRFGRFDSMEAGYWCKPLRDVGVRLSTCAQGEIDWTDFAGRMIYGIQQEGKYNYLVDLSRNVTRALRQKAEEGNLLGSRPPYGFDKVYLDASGNVVMRVKRGHVGGGRLSGWTARLVPSDDPREIETARWLFETYAAGGTSLRQLVIELQRRKIPSPAGCAKWRPRTIQLMFLNPAYVGDFVYGRKTQAKYFHVSREEVRKVSGPKTCCRAKTSEEWIVKAGTHEGIIERPLWLEAQGQLVSRQNCSTPKHKRGAEFMLSGLLYCAKCGKRMTASFSRGVARYMCQTYGNWGRKSGCGGWTVRQDDFLALLFQQLEDQVFACGDRKAIVDRAHQRLLSQSRRGPGDADRIRKRISELDREIKLAAERLLTAPDSITDVLAPQIEARRRERSSLEAQLSETARLTRPADMRAEALEVAGKMDRLKSELRSADHDRVRGVLRRLVNRVDLWFCAGERARPNGMITYPLDRGEIVLTDALLAFEPVSLTQAK